MIATIIEGLDLAASQQLPTGARSGLAELRPVGGGTAPYTYSGDGNWTQIANDNAGTYSYWRLTSPVVEVDTDGPSCNDYFQATYQLRLVSMVERALCGNVIDAARSAASAIRGADGGVATALGLSIPRTNVSMVRVDTDSSKVYQNEFGQASDVPPDRALIAIDVTFVAIGSAACFAPCEVPGSLLCLSIEHATWAKIKACMSVAQIDAAEADLCTGGGPCENAELTFANIPLLSIPAGDTEDIDCDTLLDAVVVSGATETQKNGTYTPSATVNGRTSYELAPNHVIEWNGSQYINRDIFSGTDWITNNAPATPWAGVWVEFVGGAPIDGTVAQATIGTFCAEPCEDVTIQLRDSAGNSIGSPDVYPAGTSTNKTAPDGSAQLKDSAGTNIGSAVPVRSNQANVPVTAPDGTVTVVDHLGDTIGSTTVKSNGTATVVVSDWEGEYPVLTENVPTYDDEGTSTTGWTLTAGSLTQPSASVVRFTQTTAGVAATAARAITMPVTNKDWVLYTKARAANGTGGKVIQIAGGGLERTNIGFHINYVAGSSAPGVLSIRHTTAAGTNTNAVAATAINATDYIDLALAFNSKFASLSLFSRQTNGTWKFECQIGATFHGGNLQIVVNQSGTPAWLDFDWITLVSPNIQSIGDSLTKGATLFSPTIADALNNGDSTWQRWAALYPAIRNNLTINKGVGGNTIGMVEARIQADVLDNIPALVLLGACSNDYGAGTSQADKTTNTQDCINLCATAGVPVVLFNGTYCTAAWASNPAGGAYYKEWWDDYMPTLTGLEGTIDIMGGLKDPAGYADTVLTQSDNVHPNVVGYGRMGQWIAALPYA